MPHCAGINVDWPESDASIDSFLQKVIQRSPFINLRAIDFLGFNFSEFMEKAGNVAPPPLLTDLRIFFVACDLLKLPDLWLSHLKQMTIAFDADASLEGEVELDFRAATNLRRLNINSDLPLRPNVRVNSKYLEKLELWQMVAQKSDWERLLGHKINMFSSNPVGNALSSIRSLCVGHHEQKFDFCAISWMTQLRKLALLTCRLSGSVSELSKLINLVSFRTEYVYGSQEKKDMLVDVAHRTLRFSFNHIVYPMSSNFNIAELPSLEKLVLRGIRKVHLDGARFAAASRLKHFGADVLDHDDLNELGSSFPSITSIKLSCNLLECFQMGPVVPSIRVVLLRQVDDSTDAVDFQPSNFAKIFPNAEKLVLDFEPELAKESVTDFFDQLRQ
jgi:hypothetical protein